MIFFSLAFGSFVSSLMTARMPYGDDSIRSMHSRREIELLHHDFGE
jgi:hypothetical protein